ncbi:uncharacterized protein GLRG_10928 [Colletotrichum graminicola M1.001]|uniref:Uncharacterized protein n=1 Tax=Colletotrichum graminicola (strain M1.001 / M2 / FGSC 10212) TaxID=645133 RepID=E3QY81_COLGM|nr:uncharacterized protein GLRG_10928 [Colletotrichum graminicola M1.001]EFQ35819.1 hypothetical protein GLRG_10928 [Colletotrichum graminicola M1.001]
MGGVDTGLAPVRWNRVGHVPLAGVEGGRRQEGAQWTVIGGLQNGEGKTVGCAANLWLVRSERLQLIGQGDLNLTHYPTRPPLGGSVYFATTLLQSKKPFSRYCGRYGTFAALDSPGFPPLFADSSFGAQ